MHAPLPYTAKASISACRIEETAMAKKESSGDTKKTGTYKGKSNKLGEGGRAQQLKDKGVPGGEIGILARAKGAAPGGPNFHSGSNKRGGRRT
jgi:hypothetical protein